MKRREFIALGAAMALAPLPAFANEGWVDYQNGTVAELLDKGNTVLLDYSATWCSTCKAQERAIESIRAANPAYNRAITFVRVDWDTYSRAPITKIYGIPRRSTLVLLSADQELGRIVADTRASSIQALMELAL
jgi:thiol-disulfide isomerase/thioredoxin